MNAAMATPKKPEIAGCSGCLRTIRRMVISTALPTELQIAACNPKIELIRTNTNTGTDE